ncbi:DUF6634 family protein [Tateyamaria omphalii]|nr:DUF6634 family protein [Tateyamaria omphalii]
MTDPVPDLADAPLLADYTMGLDELGLLHLVGQVSGHPKLGDRWITTSPVWQIDPDGGYARTSSRWYRLARSFRETIASTDNTDVSDMQTKFPSTEDAITHLRYIRTIVERELTKRAN